MSAVARLTTSPRYLAGRYDLISRLCGSIWRRSFVQSVSLFQATLKSELAVTTTASDAESESDDDAQWDKDVRTAQSATAEEIVLDAEIPHDSGLVKRQLYVHQPSAWKPGSVRTGAIGIKLGMMTVEDDWGARWPVTVVHIEDNHVIQVKRDGSDGCTALQIGAFSVKRVDKVPKQMKGHFAKALVAPKRAIFQFPVTPDAILPPGTPISVRHFFPGQFVDVTGIGRGKGFAGAMKRWHFSGNRASHGNSLSHRSLGATGQRQDPGRVFKGKKMPGRMGGKQRTQLGLRVFMIDPIRNVLFIHGAIPGPAKGFVRVRDAIKKQFKLDAPPPFPTFFPSPTENPNNLPDELYYDVGPDPLAMSALEDAAAAAQSTLSKTAAKAKKEIKK
eukprot:TRINITY_DN14559_c0_g1_i1.p1 TRINITY_DN14559_c0_g1~~TRINITY_DN14559_c0_g1_i1.p1  ORF type:complete len:403 (-),score=54.99 TRINITY_DN14559_c0_g1_i1:730-1896(-)